MKKSLLFLLCLILVSAPLLAASQLDEANASFTFKGKPIHPFLVQRFSNWLSDKRPPMIKAVDIGAAFDSNEYREDVVEEHGWIFSKKEDKDGDITTYESFQYLWLGKMADGTHVLETGLNGGGSGTFMDLMFVRFSEGDMFFEGKSEKQLLMSIVGIYQLGDRYEGEIQVRPDSVLIHASTSQRGGGSIEKDVELKFPAEQVKAHAENKT
jgi:hypothetical protein